MKSKPLSIVLLALFIPLFASGTSYGRDSLRTVRFSHPDIIRYDHHGFIINGKRTYIFSAGFHYYRLTPALWNDRLQKIKAAGFNTVETYVPWNFHEKVPGKTDFSELDAFIKDCARHHLWVIIRPGPYICAEWDEGGWPDWLADKEIGFRTDTPDDIKWSEYWYDEVLPVIRRHQITNGGNIILMQLENEYDYSGLPDSLRTNYIKALYQSAKKNGIDIPLITCWTSVVRNNTDNIMSQIMDADNFYPKWNFGPVGWSIATMIRTEPYSPPMVTELQGGWFSDINSKTVRHPDVYGASQVNALTKFVIAHGLDGFNYYMFYGGTNYGYNGSRGRTTSYDYTAPISEPGGLWKKYRAVKLIGDFLNVSGATYTGLPVIHGKAETLTPGINLILRGRGGEQFLYVRNVTDSSKIARITVVGSGKESRTSLEVDMPAKSAKFLTVSDMRNGVSVKDANVQLSQFTDIDGKPFILAYGHKEDPVSITVNRQHIHNRVIANDQWVNAGNALVGFTSWGRAGRSRIFENGSQKIAVVSDSYNMHQESSNHDVLKLGIQTRPGFDNVNIISGKPVTNVSVDGRKTTVHTKKKGSLYINNFYITTPSSPFKSIDLLKAGVATEPEHTNMAGKPLKIMPDGSYSSLGLMDMYDNGYFVYQGDIQYPHSGRLVLDFYNTDWHGVYIDGKYIKGLSGSTNRSAIAITDLPNGTSGKHEIKIIYENEGRNNGDAVDNQLKGLVSIRAVGSQKPIAIARWKLSPHPAGMLTDAPNQAQKWFDDRRWPDFKAGDFEALYRRGLVNQTSSWYRGYFNVSEKQMTGSDPEMDLQALYGDITVFINGHKITAQNGRYTSFNVPLKNKLHEGTNVVALYIRNGKGLGGIYRPAAISFSRNPVITRLVVREGLYGHSLGWDGAEMRGHDFNHTVSVGDYPGSDRITFYRMNFNLESHDQWTIPIAARIKATGNAQIWINGHLEGRYFSKGPQKRFYLPKPWLHPGKNTLVLVMRPSDNGQIPKLREISITPYRSYVVKNNNVTLGF